MHVCTTADLGPDFIAWVGVVHGGQAAILSPRTLTEEPARRQALELLSAAGFDCAQCTTACPARQITGER